ncbi:MAG: phosphatase PAP2 family protein [Myxococcales bacterium]
MTLRYRDSEMLSRADALPPALARCVRGLSPVDKVVVAFELFLYLRAWVEPTTPGTVYARGIAGGLLASTLVALVLTRGELMTPGRARALLHRAGLFFPMVGSYLAMRRYLPALQPDLYDPALLRLDSLIFGTTPSVFLEPLSTPAVVEWFAFFYYSYFFFLGVHLLGTLFFDRGKRADELLLGIAVVTAVGHALYTLVPGLGPVGDPSLFSGPLRGGEFWARVQQTVSVAGAQMDIFPSLHTAHPLLISMHALRHRHTTPFRQAWPLIVFAALNMVGATMVLRWHYGVDVLAGMALAVGAHRFAIRAASQQKQPNFEPLGQPTGAR